MSGSGSFRVSVQPLVRSAAIRGASIAEITSDLRSVYGRAYRRSDLVQDVSSYRAGIATITTTSAAIETALSTYRDLRGFIARIGVAAFSISLLLPTIVHGGASSRVSIASTFDDTTVVAVERIALPNAREASRLVAPTPAVEDTRLRPETNSGEAGVIVTASWYGPGFYDNRLPCWQWLQVHGLPIQFEADTWGVAHKTLPCGTMLTLSHGSNVVTVPVVDRGPYVSGRELDLSLRVKAALGCTDLCTVLMQIDQ